MECATSAFRRSCRSSGYGSPTTQTKFRRRSRLDNIVVPASVVEPPAQGERKCGTIYDVLALALGWRFIDRGWLLTLKAWRHDTAKGLCRINLREFADDDQAPNRRTARIPIFLPHIFLPLPQSVQEKECGRKMSRNSASVTRQSLGTTRSILKFSDVIDAQPLRLRSLGHRLFAEGFVEAGGAE